MIQCVLVCIKIITLLKVNMNLTVDEELLMLIQKHQYSKVTKLLGHYLQLVH